MERRRDYIDAVHDAKRLEELRALPLERKIQISQARIIEWHRHFNGKVVVSFSGGKDSTVLLHMVRSIFPDVKAVFSNTGLEYPEIQQHVMSYPNIDIIRPPMRFDQVISTYGYPLIGKEVAEAIYYARRIRSQSLNVEREQSEWMREHRYTNGSEPNLSGTASPADNAPRKEITERLQGEVLGDGESSRDTAAGWSARSSYRDKHCEEQTNSPDGQDGKRTRDRAGVVKNKPNRGVRRRTELSGSLSMDEKENRLRTAGSIEKEDSKKDGADRKSQFNKEKWLPLVYTPFLISHLCCFRMKKSPMKMYQHKNHLYPILGTLAEESRVRKQAWIRHGCNAFEGASPTSQPLSFWTEQDILAYIVKYNLPIASVYGDIVNEIDGSEFPPVDMMENIGCNLKCTGCDRTGQINAAR